MTEISTTTDDQLVDVLDQALAEMRRGKSVGGLNRGPGSADLNAEATQLLSTLLDLSEAVDTWRGCELTLISQSPGKGPTPFVAGQKPGWDLDSTCDIPLPDPASEMRFEIGRYQIQAFVGCGAMGDVFEAYDPQLDRKVAVKVPRSERMAHHRTMFTERFLREARAAAAVRHSHICPVYDAGEHSGQPYVVMAFVDGQSLEQRLAQSERLDVRQAVELMAQVADALEAIHQHGIIHRDLKPGNILIDRSGNALLTDFGLAVSAVNSERLTSDGQLVGTPVYMSPEQAAGENSTLTPASDIYSLGAVLYEVFTGEVPFRASLLELLWQIKNETPPSPSELRPELDPTLSAIALKAMSKSPKDRYASAGEMAKALQAWSTSTEDSSPVPLNIAEAEAARKFRTKPAAFAGLFSLIAFGIVWTSWSLLRNSSQDMRFESKGAENHTLIPTKPMSFLPLTGEFEILISSDPAKGPVEKQRLRIEEQRAYPLRNGELVQFEARLNQPGYIYLLWIDPDGNVLPLYPWDAAYSDAGFQAPFVSGAQTTQRQVLCPPSRSDGFEAIDPVGLQTFVLLARREPLPKDIHLEEILSGLPPAPDLQTDVAISQPRLRGVSLGKTKSLIHPLFASLESRLSPHFEFVRIMTFPQVREEVIP